MLHFYPINVQSIGSFAKTRKVKYLVDRSHLIIDEIHYLFNYLKSEISLIIMTIMFFFFNWLPVLRSIFFLANYHDSELLLFSPYISIRKMLITHILTHTFQHILFDWLKFT